MSVLDLPASSFDLARPGVAPPLKLWYHLFRLSMALVVFSVAYVCVFVCNSESLMLESSSLVCKYIFRIFWLSSCINVIGLSSYLQEQKSAKSHPATPTVTDMA